MEQSKMAKKLKTDLLREELLALKAESPDGLLHVGLIHAWAKAHPDSALHSEIEWNQSRAAREHQFSQIRRLIQLHVVTSTREPVLVSLTIDRPRGGGYRSISDVAQSKTLVQVMRSDALRELNRVRLKFEFVEALAPVWESIKAAASEQEDERASA
jgi:hypothetical protein